MKNKNEATASHLCPKCEGKNVKFGPIELKFDRHTFKGKTHICKDCDNYLTSPQFEKEIEEWAKGLAANFHQYQPTVAKEIYKGLEKLCQEHGVKPAVMAKILTTVYLERSKTIDGYAALKKFIFNSQTFVRLSSDEKERISIPVKYEIYREIREFAQIWGLKRETEVLAEAINFCIVLLCNSEDLTQELKLEIGKIKELISVQRQAPHIKEAIESDVRYIAKAA